MANVDITIGQLKQIAATINVYGEANAFPSVNLGTDASELLIRKLSAVPDARTSKFPHLRGDEVVAIESVTVTVDGVEFRASRTLPMTVVDGAA